MTLIQINPQDVQDTGGKFINMRGEVEGLVSNTRSMMSTLQGQFKGIRAGKIFSDWNDMQKSLENAITTLQSAGELLNRASSDFSDVDSRM